MNQHFSAAQSRSKAQVDAALQQLQPFQRAAYTLFPLGNTAKVPAQAGWRMADYSRFDVAAWLAKGGNVGIRLAADDIVLDIDPRNGGEGALEALRSQLRAPWLDEDAPRVRTGGGGLHLFFKLPADMRVRGKLAGFAGIDVKAVGGFVVAPGSLHPETGRPYAFDTDGPPISAVDLAPADLLQLLRRPDAAERTSDGGELSADELATLLSVLDARDYGRDHHDDWVRMAAACHDAVGGDSDGMQVWLAWCATDDDYGDAATEQNQRRWESFEAGKPGGATFKTLLKAVVDAGHPELVARLGHDPDADFDDDEPQPAAAEPSRFQRRSLSELLRQEPPAWLVDKMVPEGALVQLYGRRKSNKTFVALDLALRVAMGHSFHGVAVKRGRVVYVIGEGGGGRFADRMLAWCKFNKVGVSELDGWFAVVPMRVGVDNKTDLRDFLAGDAESAALTIFDTVARSMDGDENSTADMNRFVKGLDQVREYNSGTVLVVHHSGKDEAKQGRGSTALPGAVDATLKVYRDAVGRTALEVEEIRDAESGLRFLFESVNVVLDEDMRSSLVMRLVDEQPTAAPKNAVDLVLIRIVERNGVAKVSDLYDDSTEGMSRSNVGKAIRALREQGLIQGTGPIFATDKGVQRAIELGARVPNQDDEDVEF